MGIKGATKAEHLVLRWQKSANLRDCYLENAKGKVSFGGEGNTSLRGGATAAEGTDGSGMSSGTSCNGRARNRYRTIRCTTHDVQEDTEIGTM